MITELIGAGLAVIAWKEHQRTKQCNYTGLLNKTQFDIDSKKLRRSDDVIIIIDIDKFKQINDTCGHRRGDEIISELAKCIKNNMRLTDKAYRIGGDEFAIITNHAELGNRIKQNIKNTVSISIGTGKTYIEADVAMYCTKNCTTNEQLRDNRIISR